MEAFISAAGDYGKYQKVITAISVSLGTVPFCLTIPYSTLTKIPSFLCKNENEEYVPCEYDKT